MPETSYPISRYTKTFSDIRKAAEQHAYLWNETIPEEGLGILRIVVDEQQDWIESYGIAKSKDGRLHFYKKNEDRDEGHLITIKELAKDFQRHYNQGCHISPEEISTRFVDSIDEYFRRYQLVASKVDEKVKKKRRALEKMLSLDSEN
jgi:hypothetical protein